MSIFFFLALRNEFISLNYDSKMKFIYVNPNERMPYIYKSEAEDDLGVYWIYRSLIAEKKVPAPCEPIFFMKPTSSYITEGQCIEIPPCTDVHHEVELGVIIGSRCKNVDECDANRYIGGYCVALDLTAVNRIEEARARGEPWTKGKCGDTWTPVSEALERDCVRCPENIRLWLKVQDEVAQDNYTCDMLFPVPSLIACLTRYITLEPYDLLLTGSPAGTGPLCPGQEVNAGLGDGLITACFKVTS